MKNIITILLLTVPLLSYTQVHGIFKYNTITLQVYESGEYKTKDKDKDINILQCDSEACVWTSTWARVHIDTFWYIESYFRDGIKLHVYSKADGLEILIIDDKGYRPSIFRESDGDNWESVVILSNSKKGF